MSKELFYDGFSEYELEALNIPNQARGQCLTKYVPLIKCITNANYFSRMTGKACQDQRHTYSHCRKIEHERTTSAHLMRMRLHNPQKFEELNVAPALNTEFSPSFLNFTRH